jgi:2-dehydropantoate 2-reductase
MDILIYGAGAVGGYLGARLAQHRHNVTLITREVMAKLIGETGLELTEGGKRIVTRPTAVTSAAQAFKDGQTYDLIILTMKAYDLAAAVDPLIAFCPQPNMIITTQNGIGVEKGTHQAVWRRACDCRVVHPAHPQGNNATQLVAERTDGGFCLAPTQPKQEIKPWLKLFADAGMATEGLQRLRVDEVVQGVSQHHRQRHLRHFEPAARAGVSL